MMFIVVSNFLGHFYFTKIPKREEMEWGTFQYPKALFLKFSQSYQHLLSVSPKDQLCHCFCNSSPPLCLGFCFESGPYFVAQDSLELIAILPEFLSAGVVGVWHHGYLSFFTFRFCSGFVHVAVTKTLPKSNQGGKVYIILQIDLINKGSQGKTLNKEPWRALLILASFLTYPKTIYP